jgi:GH43 family beta-xylosidase
METFYHGTCHLFKEFSLSFLGTGEGKSKFGQGIYITSSYATAALYAAKAAKANGSDKIYVYTVEVPAIKDDNHVFSCKPVNDAVVARTETAIGEAVPEEVKTAGKLFRKYIGNLLTGQHGTVKKMMGKADAAAENAASKFLDSVGVDYLVWPQSQTKPDGETNRAVLNEGKIRILKVVQVDVDAKNKLIPGSEKEVTL